MNKYTKGPWIVKQYPKVFGITNENGRQIAIMTEHYGDCPLIPMHKFERSEQDVADGCLIAAAPELLEALKQVLKDLKNTDGSKNPEYLESVKLANKVLSKIKG